MSRREPSAAAQLQSQLNAQTIVLDAAIVRLTRDLQWLQAAMQRLGRERAREAKKLREQIVSLAVAVERQLEVSRPLLPYSHPLEVQARMLKDGTEAQRLQAQTEAHATLLRQAVEVVALLVAYDRLGLGPVEPEAPMPTQNSEVRPSDQPTRRPSPIPSSNEETSRGSRPSGRNRGSSRKPSGSSAESGPRHWPTDDDSSSGGGHHHSPSYDTGYHSYGGGYSSGGGGGSGGGHGSGGGSHGGSDSDSD